MVGLCTYFISNGIYVKIGKTQDVAARLKSLQTGSPVPLRLLGYVSGDREQEFHHKYANHRLRGEWFSLPDSFICWLLTQIGRDDWIGDLAEDMWNDGTDGHSPLTRLELTNRVFYGTGCRETQATLVQAVSEWHALYPEEKLTESEIARLEEKQQGDQDE